MYNPFKARVRLTKNKKQANHDFHTLEQIAEDNNFLELFQESSDKDKMTESLSELKIPDAVKDLPTYDGNKNTLFDFIANVEDILVIIRDLLGQPQGKIILRAIRNKIINQANEVLNMYGTPLVWEDIKANLILHYSDKRNETSLIKDLHSLKQGYDPLEVFYAKIIETFSTIINHINVHETESNVIISKKALYSEMCLNIFLSGLREPLGSITRATRPTTLMEAFNFCLKEANISYIRNTYTQPIRNYNPGQIRPILSNQARPNVFNRPNFSSQPHRPNFSNQTRLQNNSGQSRKQEPMDISSGNTRFIQKTNSGNSGTNSGRSFRPGAGFIPKYKSEELFNVDQTIQYPDNYSTQPYYEQHTELYDNQPVEAEEDQVIQLEEENFHVLASTNQSDT